MANMLLATKRPVEEGALTAEGTLAPTLPIGNLATDQPGEAARWTSLSGMAIILDLGAAKAINVVALVAHNGTSSATWRIRGATSEANLTGSPGYDSGSISMWPATGRPADYDGEKLPSIHFIDPAETWRWWRIDLADAGNPDGFFEAGALVVDAAFQPAVNLQYGFGLGFDDPSEQVQAAGGQTWSTPIGSHRSVGFVLDFESEADLRETAYEIDRRRGAKRPVLWIFDPEETTHLHRGTIYGLLTSLRPIVLSSFETYFKPYRILEMIP